MGGLLDIGVLYGGSIGHRCTVWGVYWTQLYCMGGLLDIGVLYGGSIGHRCTVWGGVYWT